MVSVLFLIGNAKKVCCAPDWAKKILIQYGKHKGSIRKCDTKLMWCWIPLLIPLWIPGSDLHTRPKLVFTLHKSLGLLAIKFEKFDLSFMIALVNLSSNGSSVSRNLCRRLRALPHMHGSMYFPNLRSKPLGRVGDRIWGSPFVLMRLLSTKIYIT